MEQTLTYSKEQLQKFIDETGVDNIIEIKIVYLNQSKNVCNVTLI